MRTGGFGWGLWGLFFSVLFLFLFLCSGNVRGKQKQYVRGRQGLSAGRLYGGSEALFEGGEELTGFGEGFDELHLVVEVAVQAELLAGTFEGVAAVACEVEDLTQEVNVAVGIEAVALLVFVGPKGGEFGLVVAQKGGVYLQHFGHFADGMVEFVGHVDSGLLMC